MAKIVEEMKGSKTEHNLLASFDSFSCSHLDRRIKIDCSIAVAVL
ncbi:hypothetical protein ACFLXV_00915 [Chloroflexota bacterium]